MNIICKLFGHKNTEQSIKKIPGYTIYGGRSNYWNCLRCGAPTQLVYWSDTTPPATEERKYVK